MKASNRLLLIILLLSAALTTKIQAQTQYRSLSSRGYAYNEGVNWRFRTDTSDTFMAASVPGCVHTDLFHAGLIPNPYYADNERKMDWIDRQIWHYECAFELGEAEFAQEYLALKFEGLDTYAEVKLNGMPLLKTDNMFRTYEVPIRKLAVWGKNHLEVVFYPVADSVAKIIGQAPHKLPEQQRVYTRKAQYQFGWDWGPRFLGCGIWKPVQLVLGGASRFTDLYLHQELALTPQDTFAKLRAEVEIQSQQSEWLRCDILIDNQAIDSLNFVFLTQPGKHNYTFPFRLDNPRLWWTNGLGAQNLYEVKVKISKVYPRTTEEIGEHSQLLGIRKLEWVREKDEKGSSFYLKLNDKPLFLKGANWIPMEAFPALGWKQSGFHSLLQADTLTTYAQQAHMNMLRVWGGGIYEDDFFYRLCAEKGLLVWQDFMFACAMYPGDSAFMQNVETEIRQQVQRLRKHSCIALWCGNNEVAEGWFNWGWQKSLQLSARDSAQIWQDYQRLFHDLIPTILAEKDPGRYYHPSSPANGWGREVAYRQDDVHYWGVWWGLADYRSYKQKVGRFVSEYGMQAFPDWQTLRSVIPENQRFLQSPALANHQKHPTGFRTLTTYLQRDFAKKVPETDLKRYAYLTNLLQADALQTAVEAHRGAKPSCMGTLYWQLNDCWQVVSWSSVDYAGKWKAAHYRVREFYKPLILGAEKQNRQLSIQAISDLGQDSTLEVELIFADFKGKKSQKIVQKMLFSPSQNNGFTVDLPRFVLASPRRTYCRYRILNSQNQEESVFEHTLTFVPPRQLKLPKPIYEIIIKEMVQDSAYNELEIRAKSFLKNVYLSFPNATYNLPENYFDMQKGEVKRLAIPKNIRKEEVEIVTY